MDTRRIAVLSGHIKAQYHHYRFFCESAALPVHMLAIGHFYSAATCIAGAITLLYIVASILKARA